MSSKEGDLVGVLNQISDEMVSADDKHLFVLDFVKLLDKFALSAQRSTVKRFLMNSLKQCTKSKSRKVHFEVFPLWLLLAEYSETMTLKEILDRVDYLYEDYFPYYRAYINDLLAMKQKDAAIKMLQRCKDRCEVTEKQLEEEFPSLKKKTPAFTAVESTIMIMDSMGHTMISDSASSPTVQQVKPKVALKPAIKTTSTKIAGGDLGAASRSVSILPSVPEAMDSSYANESENFSSSHARKIYPATPVSSKRNVSLSTEDNSEIPVKPETVSTSPTMEYPLTPQVSKESSKLEESQSAHMVSPVDLENAVNAIPDEVNVSLVSEITKLNVSVDEPKAALKPQEKFEISPVRQVTNESLANKSEVGVSLASEITKLNVSVDEPTAVLKPMPTILEPMPEVVKLNISINEPAEILEPMSEVTKLDISINEPTATSEPMPEIAKLDISVNESKAILEPMPEVAKLDISVNESKAILEPMSEVSPLVNKTVQASYLDNVNFADDSFTNSFVLSPAYKKPKYPTPMKTEPQEIEKTEPQEKFEISPIRQAMNESLANKSEVSFMLSPVRGKTAEGDASTNLPINESLANKSDVSFMLSPVRGKTAESDLSTGSPMNFGIPSLVSEIVESEVPIEAHKIYNFSKK